MPLPASSTTLNGLMTAGSMKDITLLDVVVEHVARASSAPRPRGRRRACVPRGDHVADLADAGVAAERERLARAPS